MIDDPKTQAVCSRQRNRRCLMCGERFRSDGPHHRICPRCKLSRRWREGDMAYPTHDRRRQS
jgi:uncharacterized paraquat-inducible protein A